MKHKIIRSIFALLALSLLLNTPRAQQSAPTSDDRVGLYQALLDLQNPWTVMCVAAHPDDEDGTSLIVMRRKYGAHTISLFSTFGEGGQNAIGPELYEQLGAIRARETMAAAEIQGSEPHFLGLKDFGYSKTADEAFRFWGHEEGLRRMVLEIRKLRPDVIITNHSVTSNDHGQHQATARMVVEAFDAAADPNKFPEQLKDGVTIWQVQRLFVRARGNATQNADTQFVTIDPNERDPVRGVVYAEEALRALQKHATQGPWPSTFAEYANRFRAFSGQTGGTPGQLPMIRYALVREAKGTARLDTKDSHNFLDGLRLTDTVASQVTIPQFNSSTLELANHPEATAKMLRGFQGAVLATTRAHPVDGPRRERMQQEFERATALASGIHFQIQPSTGTVLPNSTLNMAVRINNSGTEAVNVTGCDALTPTNEQRVASNNERRVNHVSATASRIDPGAVVTVPEKIQVPASARINLPMAQHLYEATGLGLNLVTRCSFEVSGTKLGIDLTTRVDVAPQVEIKSTEPSLLLLTPQTESRPPSLQVTVMSHLNEPANVWVGAFANAAGKPSINLVESAPRSLAPGELMNLRMDARSSIQAYSNIEISAALERAKTRSVVAKATLPIVRADARVASNLKVGYIRGFDFSLPNALSALGVESKELSVDEVGSSDLSKYTSVIVDNRVYESQPSLIAVNQKLLDYANSGGTLIVFYHKSDEWNPDPRRNRPQLAPYKLVLGNERITDENAPISFIEPDHPLLNMPNKMSQEDFKDWIQERGLYYPREWDAQFHALLQSNDPGEAPLKGGLLVADYGRGHYIYTSMVWYRELRGGVPGAYRMLANMISYGRK
ncbi:MAG: PIG-L deacetylase family protein [Pyrinomonadaceae bacterium]